MVVCRTNRMLHELNRFDAGPSLWAGMSEPGTNPLRQILDVLEEEVRGWGKPGYLSTLFYI